MRTTSFSTPDYIPEWLRVFLARRAAEIGGLLLLATSIAMSLALMSWSVQDASLNHATRGPIRNLLGAPGAIASDLVMQMAGLSCIAMLAPLIFWGWRLLTRRHLGRARMRLALWLAGSLAMAGLASALPVSDRWPLPTGLGGVIGDAMLYLPHRLLGTTGLAMGVVALALAIIAILGLTAATGYGLNPQAAGALADHPAFAASPRPRPAPVRDDEDEDADSEPGFGIVSVGAIVHAWLSLRAAATRRWQARKLASKSVARAPWLTSRGLADDDGDDEAAFSMPTSVAVERREPTLDGPRFEPGAFAPRARAQPPQDQEPAQPAPRHIIRPEAEPQAAKAAPRIVPPAAAIAPGKRVLRENQPMPFERGEYELPPLELLTEAKKIAANKISEDALEQNARLLEGVLDDFGVKGEIINVRPGPVVTLYELEPAPGIKSSRVIGLADDIARSMSAISARVAVVQGRNAIGVELPNQRRETVYLRELLASADFENSKHKLAIALGKTIGGEPVIVDLARMPHLLVAGTTGSGKSVAINTMILSLLYRLKPEECRLIMVDPKMLELSVYDGIPHLLTPVVTDPKKAVVALKWAVREMEDRYKKMSKVNVRNIDGFNARVLEAEAKNEAIMRIVQTGYDRETGEAIYEQEAMELTTLPYIVVVVDEMADLMMVAGKDIEGAIQRLAQMARAAGIHLIMATQRPSVDVITGTIKANFPTRISFQVTSKIDSRTILGEQGGEQLLGQGDMLYMAGGGRISRVHGPFVSDTEVEQIVAHLKTQGQPEYLDAIVTEDETPAEAEPEPAAVGSMDADESADMYDRAVNIVLKDRKCSTSYIQRRLSVGYNKAASLVERMEREGVVGAPNHSGKREILAGGGVDRGAFELANED